MEATMEAIPAETTTTAPAQARALDPSLNLARVERAALRAVPSPNPAPSPSRAPRQAKDPMRTMTTTTVPTKTTIIT